MIEIAIYLFKKKNNFTLEFKNHKIHLCLLLLNLNIFYIECTKMYSKNMMTPTYKDRFNFRLIQSNKTNHTIRNNFCAHILFLNLHFLRRLTPFTLSAYQHRMKICFLINCITFWNVHKALVT